MALTNFTRYQNFTVNTEQGPWGDSYLSGSFYHTGGGPGNHVNPVAFSYWKQRCTPPFGKYSFRGGPYNGAWVEGCLHWNTADMLAYVPAAASAAEDADYNQALSKLTEKVRGSIDLSIDMAQMGLTKQMLIQTAKFTTYVRDFKREFRTLPLRALGSKWLEYKYGWMPTIQTIYDLGKKICSTDPDDHKLVLHERGSSSFEDRFDYWYGQGNSLLDVKRSYSTRVEIGLALSPTQSRLNQLASYTSLNPVSIAWELLPYSFVVDWFIDVGGYLRNAETALAYQDRFLYGYVSRSRRLDVHLTPKNHKLLGGSNGTLEWSTSGHYQKVVFSRSVLASYPLPRFPVLDPHLGSSRLLSAASLLSQFLGRGR